MNSSIFNIPFPHVILLLTFHLCIAITTEIIYQNILENNCIQKCQKSKFDSSNLNSQNSKIDNECEIWEYDHGKGICTITLTPLIKKSEKNQSPKLDDDLITESNNNSSSKDENDKSLTIGVMADSEEPSIKTISSDESIDEETTKSNSINLKHTIDINSQSLLNKTNCNVIQNRKYKGKFKIT